MVEIYYIKQSDDVLAIVVHLSTCAGAHVQTTSNTRQ